MTPKIIVSYDGTANDQDALELTRLIAADDTPVALAYVRHARNQEPGAEIFEAAEAERMLERGATAIGRPDAARHVVLHTSTGEGLRQLAEAEQATLVVFGSDYRTAPGAVSPGTSAERLLNGGPAAVAIAPAGLRSHTSAGVDRIGVLAETGDDAASETARSLAAAIGARVMDHGEPVDLLVVASRAEAPQGRVLLSARAEYAIATARCPLIAVGRGAALDFAARPALVTT
jgi:nucleotide-binding universal stress UspA family protein